MWTTGPKVTSQSDPPTVSLLPAENGLDNGGHFLRPSRASIRACPPSNRPRKPPRAERRSVDGFTVSVAKGAAAGTVVAHAFEKVVGWVKEYTVEAAKLAARNETLAVVNQQLARANGYQGDSIERLVERVKALGITTQAARDTVNKMIAAQLDLSKATDLARLAQDAAVVAGENSSQALHGIMHRITNQQIEVLRTYGINVTFEREFAAAGQRLGRDLTDIERKNTALNRVLAEGPKIAGAYEASLGTVGKQMSSLERYVEEAKAAIGEAFLPEMRKAVSGLTELAKCTKENADAIATWAKGIAAAALGAAIGKFITWVASAKKAVDALTLTLARNPLTALAIATTVAGAALYEIYQDSLELERQLKEQNKVAAESTSFTSGPGRALLEFAEKARKASVMEAWREAGAIVAWSRRDTFIANPQMPLSARAL